MITPDPQMHFDPEPQLDEEEIVEEQEYVAAETARAVQEPEIVEFPQRAEATWAGAARSSAPPASAEGLRRESSRPPTMQRIEMPVVEPEPLMASPVEPAVPAPAPPRFEFFRRERPAFMSRFESIETGPEVHETTSTTTTAAVEPEPAKPEPPKDDIDIPAFLRRERKLFQ
jgi:hypothetical protein